MMSPGSSRCIFSRDSRGPATWWPGIPPRVAIYVWASRKSGTTPPSSSTTPTSTPSANQSPPPPLPCASLAGFQKPSTLSPGFPAPTLSISSLAFRENGCVCMIFAPMAPEAILPASKSTQNPCTASRSIPQTRTGLLRFPPPRGLSQSGMSVVLASLCIQCAQTQTPSVTLNSAEIAPASSPFSSPTRLISTCGTSTRTPPLRPSTTPPTPSSPPRHPPICPPSNPPSTLWIPASPATRGTPPSPISFWQPPPGIPASNASTSSTFSPSNAPRKIQSRGGIVSSCSGSNRRFPRQISPCPTFPPQMPF
eukprot:Sdes_comp20376_c0_seq1m14234